MLPFLSFLLMLSVSLSALASTVHAGSVDLTVDSTWLENAATNQVVASVAPGEQFNIVASVKNIGDTLASGYYLDVYYDSDYGRGGPDNIAPSEVQVWYAGPLTAQAGSHIARWVIDPDNQIAELDESNNQKDYAFTFGSETTTTSITTSNSLITSATETTTTPATDSTTSSTFTSTTNSTSTTTLPQATVSITVTANPVGSVVVDGATYTLPQAFVWVPGSSHTIAANSPISGAPGTQYVWASWADGGTQSRAVMAPSSPTTYTANYQTQYQVAFAINPSGGGAIAVNGQPSAAAWYVNGAVVGLQADSNPGYAFSSWSSGVASTTFTNSSSALTTVTIGGSGTITASFLPKDTAPPVITPTVNPSANGYGWNSGPVSVNWSVLDPESGIASSNGCTSTSLSAETPQTGTTLTCTATNAAGLSNSVSVTVKTDLTAPALTLPPLTLEAAGPSGALVSYSMGASDSLSGLNTLSCTPPSGSSFPIGTTTVSCSATDKAGNAATGAYTVTVADRTPPKLQLPSDMTVQATGASGAVVKFSASASDLVDGSVPVTCSPASGSTFSWGTTEATCSAKDKAGNSASGSFNVTVPAVTVKLLASNGSGLSGGVVQYYNGGWKSFGTTGADGTVSRGLPAGTYLFQISYAGASQQKSQNVGTDPNVIFQTVQVHSDSGRCVSYHAGGWRPFEQDMQLLPGTYKFRFSDRTRDTSYTLVVGAVTHIY